MAIALHINGLRKQFGSHIAVNALNLTVSEGTFYALLGPNGAGKTTTLRMVTGLLRPDEGDAVVFGRSITQEPAKAKRLLAYLPDEPMLYGKLRPLEYLEFVAGLWNIPAKRAEPKAIDLLKQLSLWDVRDDFAETFSRGMKQKLALAGAFIHEPHLIILDEPLSGLDAAAARLVKSMLNDHVAQGNTVIFTTHTMEIAERTAQRIGIINHGQLIAEGTLDELRSTLQDKGSDVGSDLESIFLELTEQNSQEATESGAESA
ncbi:MAG: ABC transporter ATP-binding protein [Leptolyngbyaceae bacterium]|nr:ABC transporter ATP-binding protein [Leptolyngbyaceae bacterium]